MDDRVRHGNGDLNGVNLRRVTVVDRRLVAGVVVASVRGRMVVVGRVGVVGVVGVGVGTSRRVGD